MGYYQNVRLDNEKARAKHTRLKGVVSLALAAAIAVVWYVIHLYPYWAVIFRD
jgi:hypothetical protein